MSLGEGVVLGELDRDGQQEGQQEWLGKGPHVEVEDRWSVLALREEFAPVFKYENREVIAVGVRGQVLEESADDFEMAKYP